MTSLALSSIAPFPLPLPEPLSAPIPAPRQRTVTVAWHSSPTAQAAAGCAVGLMMATVPHALLSDAVGARVFAPAIGQALLTTGATVGTFSHVSALRRHGGDPFGYGMWRAVGAGTALSVLSSGVAAACLGGTKSIDLSLARACLLSSLAIVACGARLQTALDRQCTGLLAVRRRQKQICLDGSLFAAAICWQAFQLLSHTRAAAHAAGTAAQLGIAPTGGVFYVVAASMCASGVALGLDARAKGNERTRLFGFALALAALPVAVLGVAA